MTTTATLGPADLVRYLFDRFAAGDVDAALAKWRADARWRAVTPVGIKGFDQPRTGAEYFGEILPYAFTMLTNYTYELVDLHEAGPLAIAHVRSSWDGEKGRDEGEGVMIFRVVDGEVADLYVINGAGAGIF